MEPSTVDGGKGTIELDAGGFFHLVWKPRTALVAEDVHAAIERINELADGAEYPMLIDITNTRSITREAKTAFSTKCSASRIALLGANPVNRVIANFAMSRRTLPCPTRFFASRDEAMHWLMEKPVP